MTSDVILDWMSMVLHVYWVVSVSAWLFITDLWLVGLPCLSRYSTTGLSCVFLRSGGEDFRPLPKVTPITLSRDSGPGF